MEFTLDAPPESAEAKDEAALPFGLVLWPLGGGNDGEGGGGDGDGITPLPPFTTHARDLGRCASCFAYASAPCTWGAKAWSCALCGHTNAYLSSAGARYAHPAARAAAPELDRRGVVDVPDGEEEEEEDGSDPAPPTSAQPGGLPATRVVGVVDVGSAASAPAVADAARAALTAVSGALPPRARLGVASVSTQLTLYDCRDAEAPLGRVVSLLDGEVGPPAPLELGDALPAPAFLTPLPGGAGGVGAALDAVAADAAAGGGGGCAMGAALQALLAYLSAGGSEVAAADAGDDDGTGPPPPPPPSTTTAAPPPLLGTRVMLFLGGPPGAGRGAVTSSSSYATTDDPSAFWAAAGEAAAALGVIVDVFLLDGRGAGAAAMAPLASTSGGSLRVFTPDGLAERRGLPPTGDDARLAGFARYLVSPARRAALAGEVRLRIPPALAVGRSYAGMAVGHGASCEAVASDGYATFACARAETALAFDLEHAPGRSGRLSPGAPLVAQAAIRYWCLTASPPATSSPFTARRRLRVITCTAHVHPVDDPALVHAHASPAPVLALLAHKAVRAAAQCGGAGAQALLRDWFVLLVSARAHVDGPSDPEAVADARFRLSAGPSGSDGGLRPLPRLVYGLHRSPLLSPDADARAAAAAALGFLPPLDLARALYPELTAWTSVDEVVCSPEEEGGEEGEEGGAAAGSLLDRPPRQPGSGDDTPPPLLLPLTAAALACGPPLYLLDGHDNLVVACVPGRDDAAPTPPPPFPPPRGSALRAAVEAARAGRAPGPRLTFVSGVEAASAALAAFLVDDKGEEDGTIVPGGGGLSAFLAGVTEDARSLLREGAGV